jgi:hypothetical protein
MSFGGILKSQDIKGVEEKGIVYKYVKNSGFTLHTQGLGINYRRGKHLTGFSYRFWDFSIVSMKHPKEIRSVNPFSSNNGGFIYGKLIGLSMIRAGIGKQKAINKKGDIGGVELSYGYYGGFSLAIERPIYLNIFYVSDQTGVKEKVEKYNPDIHFPDNIAGRASIWKGFSEPKFHPGLYASFVLNAEFGKEPQKLHSLETGVTIDAFLNPIQIMAFNKPTNAYVTLFIRYLFGKKWNRA